MVQSTSSRLGFKPDSADESVVVDMVVDDDDDNSNDNHRSSPTLVGQPQARVDDEDDSVELELQGTLSNLPLLLFLSLL